MQVVRRGERGSITHRLSMRAARLLATDPQQRKTIFDRTQAIYRLRSAAAHGTDLDAPVRDDIAKQFKDPAAVSAIHSDAQSLVSAVALKIIELGAYPDYLGLELQ